ncbi:MAG: oligosaccharide flippase family protein [Halobacteriota archaeon]
MDVYRNFTKGVSLIGIANALVSVSGIILLPILTRGLATGDYGAYVQVTTTVALLAFPLTLGLSVALIRLVALQEVQADIREDFYSLLLVVVSFGVLVSGVLLALSRPLAAYLFNGNLIVAAILPLLTLLTSLNIFLLDFFRAFQQHGRYAFFLVIQTYVGVVFVSYFIFAGRGVTGAVLGLLLSQVVLFAILLSIIVARIGVAIPRLRRLRQYMAFSVPLIPANLTFWVVNSSDRYLIGVLLGASYVAFYAPSYTLGFVISMLAWPLVLMITAALPRHYDDADFAVIKTVFKYALKYFLAVAIPAVFIISSLSRPLLLFLSTPEIAANGYLVTPFIAVSALLWGIGSILGEVFVLGKKTRIVGVLWAVSGVMNVGLNVLLIPYFGIIGAAVTTLASFTFTFVAMAYYSRGHMSFDIDASFIVKSVVASLAVTAVILGLDLGSKLNVLVAASAGAAVYIVLIVLMKGFDKTELTFFTQLFRHAPDK